MEDSPSFRIRPRLRCHDRFRAFFLCFYSDFWYAGVGGKGVTHTREGWGRKYRELAVFERFSTFFVVNSARAFAAIVFFSCIGPARS